MDSNERTPLLPSIRYTNDNGSGSRTRRRVFFLVGCVGLVGLIGTVGVLRPGFTSTLTNPEVLTRSLRSAISNSKLTVDEVIALAREVGSTALNPDVDAAVCDTEGCLNAAARLLKSFNFSVDPCDDFFEYTCGGWIAGNQIPPSSSRWSQFNSLREEVNNITQKILREPKDPADPKPVNQVKDFFKDCIDIETLEAVGVKPIRDTLQEADHGDWPILIGSEWKLASFDWIKTMSDLRRNFLDTAIISVSVDQDIKDSDNYAIYVDQPSLILPRTVLINENGSYDNILNSYKEYIVTTVRILADAGGESPDEQSVLEEANKILSFEIEIAKLSTKDEFRTDTERIYNPFEIHELQSITDKYGDLSKHLGVGLDWLAFLKNIFKTSGVTLSESDRVILLEKEYLQNLIPLLLATDPRTVANYLQLRYVSGLAGTTTKEMRDAAFKFNQILTGAKEPQTREKGCADSANNGFGMAIGVKYIVAANFDEKAKEEVNSMVEDLRVSFKGLLKDATWMDAETKATAQDKADKMRSFMAYPDWLTDSSRLEAYYEGLEILPSNHFQSILQLSQWSGDKQLSKLREPVDRDFWLTYPGVVNAFYAPTYNSITFPAGILQTPFFKWGTPASINYGGIGVVIGHEITHGFDNSGRQYDAKGNASPWWTNETLRQYTEKANCIRDQYSAFKPPEVNLSVNGLLTLGENIADNGGLRESYLAYKRYVAKNGAEKRLPGLENLKPEQLFFLGYANVWCESITTQGLTNQLLTDPHSPARFRVRGPLSNNAEFANAFECPIGSPMNPGPDKRCTLW